MKTIYSIQVEQEVREEWEITALENFQATSDFVRQSVPFLEFVRAIQSEGFSIRPTNEYLLAYMRFRMLTDGGTSIPQQVNRANCGTYEQIVPKVLELYTRWNHAKRGLNGYRLYEADGVRVVCGPDENPLDIIASVEGF